jgi:hypothetical protein
MYIRLLKTSLKGIICFLAIGAAVCVWFLYALFVEEYFGDYWAITEMGLIIPQWYQMIVYYIVPICILIIIIILAVKKNLKIPRWTFYCLLFMFIADGIYLGFQLPGNLALAMEKKNETGHILGLSDMLGFILLNLFFLIIIYVIIWFCDVKSDNLKRIK